MKNFYLISSLLLSTAFSTAIVKADTRTVSSTTYGDTMGGSIEKVSGKTVYFYDKDNKLIRRAQYLADTQEALSLNYYYFFEYNENGQLSKSFYKQKKVSGWGTDREVMEYVYDAQGHLIQELNGGYYTRTDYTYEGDNRVKAEVYGTYSAPVLKSTTIYSDFVEGAVNCPKKEEVTAYTSYYTINEYTPDFKILSRTSYNSSDDSKKSKREYVYDAETGKIITELIYNVISGEFAFSEKVSYEYPDANSIKYGSVYWNTSKSDWGKQGICKVDTMQTMKEELAAMNLTVENISTKESPNSVRLNWQAPAALDGRTDYKWQVFRNGELAATLSQETEFSESALVDGFYDYVVRYVEGDKAYNSSNAVTINLETVYSPVTNIHATAYRVVATKDKETAQEYDEVLATIEWDAPADAEGLLSYNIYVYFATTPQYTGVTETSAEISLGTVMKETVYIEAVYATGSSELVKAEIDLNSLALGSVNLAPKAYVEGNKVVMPETSDVMIYNLQGKMVAQSSQTRLMDLSSLGKGVFVISVKAPKGGCTLKTVR